MDIIRQLTPLYQKHQELSLANMDGRDFLTTMQSIQLSSKSQHYRNLSSSLTSTMTHHNDEDQTISQEEFIDGASKLISQFPIPPIHKSASGTYATITDIPPILMCESNLTFLFEELLYGSKSIDELVNSGSTALLEQFLFMRSEIITNSYISFLRECHEDVVKAQFEITPRSVLFANSKLSLNQTYSLIFTVTNLSNTQQTIFIQPISSFSDMHFTISLSTNTLVIKKGKSVTFTISICFTKSSTKLSKIILLSSESTRDFITISATSKSMTFGVDPSYLPCYKDQGYHVPIILSLLRKKLIDLNGFHEKGIFRLSCCIEESEKMIDWINERCNQITEDFDLPITDVNLVTFLIKYFYRSLPTLILNHLDLSTVSSCKTIQDVQTVIQSLPTLMKELLMWFVDLMATVSSYASENGMNENNCARMLAPNLFTIEDAMEYNQILPSILSFCEMLISSRKKNV